MDPWASTYKSHQGNVGLGMAIAYYTSNCIPVLIPLNDTQKYDLVVDKNGELMRVSVKTTQFKDKNNYQVLLKKCGGSSGKAHVKTFDNTSCDILFVFTKQGTMYEIPTNKINVKTSLTLNKNFDKYIVTLNQGTSAQNESSNVEVG